MDKKTPYLLNSGILPDITLLSEASQRIAQFNRQFKGSAFEVLPDIWKIVDSPAYKQAFGEAELLARAAVDYTIYALSNAFNLDLRFGNHLPSVVVLDDLQVERHKDMISLDYDTVPFSNVPLTYFTPRGAPFFDQPEGPVISLYLPSIGMSGIVEECFHFLQWFYETDEFEKGIRSPNWNHGYFNPKNEGGRIESDKMEGSPILSGRFVPPTLEEGFSSLIVRETAAYFVRSLFSLQDETAMEDIHDKDCSVALLEELLGQGRVKCYSQLLQSHDASSFDELVKRRHFSIIGGVFPENVTHFLGYNLGQELHHITYDQSDLDEVSKIIFSKVQSPNVKLDQLVTVLQKRVDASKISLTFIK